ncbi:MAG TPA: hypothetical protein VHM91_09945 [Verrucomicrobiales bacterium]|nr:hypothetical protein [Verrucomicrobiales bacterium]
MLETFRKHHYILMLLIAIVVVISFTFLSNPTDRSGRGGGGGSQRVFTLYNSDVTRSEFESIHQEMGVAGQLSAMSQGRDDSDPVTQFVQEIGSIVNTANPTDRDTPDIDPPKNILVLRHECEKLGIAVEREDLEKFIKEIGAFKSNGGFDSKKLQEFLTSGRHGDREATEKKLFATLRDVMLFQRVSQLVGGTFAPSKAEVDADYAEKHQRITTATVLIPKKTYENQTVTDEDAQKYYDGEKTKHEAAEKAKADAEEKAKRKEKAAPVPIPADADPLVLSDEKRTVKYIVTEAPKAPVAPTPPPPLPPMEDVSKLPEDQKKAKEEEYKKKQEEHTKADAEYQKRITEHAANVTKYEKSKNDWLKRVGLLSDAIAAEDRGNKTLEDLAKASNDLAKPADDTVKTPNFEIKTASFTKAAPPEDLKVVKPQRGDTVTAIFQAEKGGGETFVEGGAQESYCIFTVTEVEKSSLLPMDQVKQKILDKLKAEKVAAAMKAAAESARSNVLEAIKGGKSFKDAAAAVMLTAAELPPFSKEKTLPPATPNSAIVTQQGEKLNAGEISSPQDVPDGLLLVYVEKKELPRHPDMEQQKKDLAKMHTYTNAAVSMGGFDQSRMKEIMEKYTYFGKRGGMSNPVLKAWFAESRRAAESISE